jgi:hypothetical protein
MFTFDQRMAQAVQLHEAGRLGEAAVLYRGFPQEAPPYPHARHFLGVLARHSGTTLANLFLAACTALARHGSLPCFAASLRGRPGVLCGL